VEIRSTSVRVETPAKVAVVNINAEARGALARAAIDRGLALLSVPHTTCGLCVNEDEAGLREDLVCLALRLIDTIRPPEGFHHDRVDDNARAHLTAVLIGHSITIPVAGGDLVLGAWQSLFLVEIDGPRTRRLDMLFLGD